MSQLKIESALNYRLEQYLLMYPIDTDFPNTNYAPVEGIAYLKVDFLPIDPVQREYGSDAQNRTEGIYQIIINASSGNGKYDTIAILDQLEEYFKRGTPITNPADGTSVWTTKFYLGPYIEDPAWFRQVIRINFRSDLSN